MLRLLGIRVGLASNAAPLKNWSVHVKEHTETLDHIDRIRAALDAAEAAGSFVVNASELDTQPVTPPVEPQAPTKSSPLLNAADLRTSYLKLLRHPTSVEELSPYQKAELQVYSEQEKMSNAWLAVELIDSNLGHTYPSEYQNGQKAEYWMQKSVNYRDSLRALQLLTLPRVPTL